MTSIFDVEGVNISNISLVNPQPHGKSTSKSKSKSKFYVRISFGGKAKTSKETEKKSLDGDRVIWNQSFSFAGSIADSVITFQIFKNHFLHGKLIGSLEKEVTELISLQRDCGSCTFDVGRDSGQLTFSIEPHSAILLDIIAEASEASTRISTVEGPAKIANVVNSAHNTLANQEDIWSSFLSQFQIFVNVIDKIAEVHPYAKLAWSILSVIPKTAMSLKDRNESVKQLCEKLKETYDFITDAERLPKLSETQSNLILKLVQQTIECGYFIREYSRGNIVGKIWKGAKVDDKIKSFIDKFDHIKKVMIDSSTLETNIVTLRVSENVSGISKSVSEMQELTLLNEMPYARDAGFVTQKRCLPGTRQGLIQEIIDWVNDDTSQQILVLSGAAGTGKSAIAHTIAEIFRKQNRLGSLFCFSRSYKDRRSFLFSTISRGLADTDVLWRKGLTRIIEDTAIRTSTDMETQFNELIVKPSRETVVVGPVIIIIDALDESGDRAEREALLNILFSQLSELPNNYRILLTTRPETDIEPRCQWSTVVCKRMADTALDRTLSDIQSYVSFRLRNIAATLDEIQSDWRDVLAKRSEGLFQWAETVCRYIDPTVRNPALVKKRWKACTAASSTSLNELYHDIISSQQEARDSEYIDEFKMIISAIMAAREPLTVSALGAIFQGIVEDVQTILDPFGSLLMGVHDSFTPVRPLHTSLFDFFHSPVQNEAKDNQYYVDTSDQSVFSLGCLRLLIHMLHFNICNLETSHLRNRDIPDLDVRVRTVIPLELSYSCRFWAYHLRYSRERRDLVPKLRTLMHEKLLYLFEALSLLGDVEQGCVAMRVVSSWCKDVDNDLAEAALDAWQFGFDFGEVMTESTPHLYLSALPCTPSSSFIFKQYLPIYPQLFSFEVDQSFDSPTQTGLVRRKNPPALVVLLVFSPRNSHIATAFSDGTLWIWDYETGEIICEWKSRDDKIKISDIVFSPDGRLIYWCFEDASIQICNVWAKEAVVESYQKFITESEDWDLPWWCTISSDGRYIASYAGNELVLYDRETCQKLIQFKCAPDLSSKPAFSPNGDMLIFPAWTSNGAELWLWDTRRQALKLCLKMTGGSSKFALSDKHFAFGKFRNTEIEIWDIPTLTEVGTLRPVDSSWIRFINDRYLVVAPQHEGYSIWDVSTGECIVETLYDIRYSKVAFHESKLIALGIYEAIRIRQWGAPVEPKTFDDDIGVNPEEFWLRGRYLIQIYHLRNADRLLRISDIRTVNNIVFEAQNLNYVADVAVSSPSDDIGVHVAYCTRDWPIRRLHLWSDIKGDSILDEGEDIDPGQFSPAGDRLISLHGKDIVKIWDPFTRALIGGPYRIGPHTECHTLLTPTSSITRTRSIPSTPILTLSASSDNFLVAYRASNPAIEVRECQTGRISRGPFKISKSSTIAFSAHETRIVCLSESHIEILDAQTGKREVSLSQDELLPQLSRNRKHTMWFLNKGSIIIWDIDQGVQFQKLSFNGYLRSSFFSDDSAQIMALYSGIDDNEYHFDIWDISTRKTICRTTGIYTAPGEYINYPVPLSDGNHFAFIPDDYHVIISLDMSVHKIMSLLYERHRKNSRFGMLPMDHSETRQAIQALNGSTSATMEILEYALTAWNKALFSQAFQREDSNGWILGPHGELLFWVPKNRRGALWRPCATHIAAKDFTKLNFDKFVHGSRWTECKGPLNAFNSPS